MGPQESLKCGSKRPGALQLRHAASGGDLLLWHLLLQPHAILVMKQRSRPLRHQDVPGGELLHLANIKMQRGEGGVIRFPTARQLGSPAPKAFLMPLKWPLQDLASGIPVVLLQGKQWHTQDLVLHPAAKTHQVSHGHGLDPFAAELTLYMFHKAFGISKYNQPIP